MSNRRRSQRASRRRRARMASMSLRDWQALPHETALETVYGRKVYVGGDLGKGVERVALNLAGAR